MKIPPMPFTMANWSGVTPTVHPGVTGQAICRTFTIGDLRVRRVEHTQATARIVGAISDMFFTFSEANSIPNFAMSENSSYCRE